MYWWSDIWEVSEGLWEASGASGEHPGGIQGHLGGISTHTGGIRRHLGGMGVRQGDPRSCAPPIGRENGTSRVPTATNQVDARLQDYKLHNNNATRLQPYRDYKAAGLQDYKTT